jgi:hypothetical protein
MTFSLLRRLAALLLAAVFVFSVAGCWNPFAPPNNNPPEGGQEEYPLRTSPTNVLKNIVTAYNYRNAGAYLDCLSEDFIFYTSEEDINDPTNPLDPEWYKSDETIMHNNMFADGSNVESISLTLTDSDIEIDEGDPQDPSDDTAIFQEAVDLRLGQTGGLLLLATTPSEFRFRIAQEPGPNGETLWEIYKWYDLGPPTRDEASADPGTELVSLGRIKSLYAE